MSRSRPAPTRTERPLPLSTGSRGALHSMKLGLLRRITRAVNMKCKLKPLTRSHDLALELLLAPPAAAVASKPEQPPVLMTVTPRRLRASCGKWPGTGHTSHSDVTCRPGQPLPAGAGATGSLALQAAGVTH
jgi:hypothetical protein